MDPQKKPEKTLNYKEKARLGLVQKKPRTPMVKKPTKLAQVSSKTATGKRTSEYHAWMSGMKKRENFKGLDPHHPFGRWGDNIFRVVFVTREQHDWIHENPNEAYRQGWLQPEYKGHQPKSDHPKPWRREMYVDKKS